MTSRLPSEWVTKKPIEKYETQFFYVGLSRYDTTKKTLSNIVRMPDGTTLYTETPYEGNLARCYVTEYATITVYSTNPRVWVEDMGVNDHHAFVQKQPTQVS
jgi:hypothetical protein